MKKKVMILFPAGAVIIVSGAKMDQATVL